MQNTTPDLIRITKREREILFLISKEYTAVEIADRLHVSAHTVITHRKNLYFKLHAKNGAGLIRRAFEVGILQIAVTAA